MKLRVINRSSNPLPRYETAGAAGMDLMANEAFTIWPGQTILVRTGLFVAIPEGYELQIRSRSGLAAKKGIVVLNSPGTIDSDYRGEISVILHCALPTGEGFSFDVGARIAQAVLAPVVRAEWDLVDSLEETSRKDGGFGSTGLYTV